MCEMSIDGGLLGLDIDNNEVRHNIDVSPKGRIVYFKGTGGRNYDLKTALKTFDVGQALEIIEIEVSNYSSNVIFKGFDGQKFNSTLFSDKKVTLKEKKAVMKEKRDSIESKRSILLDEVLALDEKLKVLDNLEKPYVAVVQSYSGGGHMAFDTLEKAENKLNEYGNKTYFKNGLNYGVYLFKYNVDGSKKLLDSKTLQNQFRLPIEFQ